MRKIIIISLAMLLLASTGFAAEIGQKGSSNAAANAGSNSSVRMGDSYYEGNDRGVNGVAAPVGDMAYPGMPGRFDGPSKDPSYMRMPVMMLLEWDADGFTTAEAKNMAKGGSKVVLVRPKFGPAKEEDRLPLDAKMSVLFDSSFYTVRDKKGKVVSTPTHNKNDFRSLGVIVVLSNSKKSITADVFARAQIEAHKLGGTDIYVKIEGYQNEVHTSGKGIGFSWTGTTISGGSTSANTGVMGFGASWGQAGYYDHPFVIVHVLANKTKAAPVKVSKTSSASNTTTVNYDNTSR